MKGPVVTAMAGLLLFLVLTIVSTLIAKLGIGMSLSVLDATNRKPHLWYVKAVVDIFIAKVQETGPCEGGIWRGTPPNSVLASDVEVAIIVSAVAARQT